MPCRGKKNGSQWIRHKRRLAIYLRDGFRCAYCRADLSGAAPDTFGLDHLRCWSKMDRPDNRSENLITACRSCNSSRKDMPLAAFVPNEFARDAIYRQARRSMRKFLAQASAILDAATDWSDALSVATTD